MYYERQRGDMCRLHSLNAYFGFQKFDYKTFFNYCDEYDKVIVGLNSRSMDGFSEGRCIINYIIDKTLNKYTLTIPINLFKNSRENIDLKRYNKLIKHFSNYFEFNKKHVWLNKKKDNEWWKLDSISGINRIDPILKDNGYILVFDNIHLLIREMDYYRNIIKKNEAINEIYWCNLYHSTKILKKFNIKNNNTRDIIYNFDKFIESYRKTNMSKKTQFEIYVLEKMMKINR